MRGSWSVPIAILLAAILAAFWLLYSPLGEDAKEPESPTWDGSAEFGLRQWDLVQELGNANVQVVGSPALSGHKAFRFTVNGGERVELNSRSGPNRYLEGSQWWFGDVLYVPSDPNKTVGWDPHSHHTLMQWKNDGTGSPPLELDRRENGLLLKVNTSRSEFLLVPEASLYDRAIAIEVRIRFSSDQIRGEIEAWVDGERKLGPIKTATLFAGKFSYLKQGQYGVGRGNVILWHGVRLGNSREAVVR